VRQLVNVLSVSKTSAVGHREQSLRSAILTGLGRTSRVVASNYSDEVIVRSDTEENLLFVVDTVDFILSDLISQVRHGRFLLRVYFSVINFWGLYRF